MVAPKVDSNVDMFSMYPAAVADRVVAKRTRGNGGMTIYDYATDDLRVNGCQGLTLHQTIINIGTAV